MPTDERGQTIAAEFGWPFVVLATTEAYSLDIAWAERRLPIALYVVADLLIAFVVAYSSTRLLSSWLPCLRGESSVAATLAVVAAFACLLPEKVDWYWYNDGVGAFSAALFRCIDALILLLVVLTWYYLITRLSARLVPLFNRRDARPT